MITKFVTQLCGIVLLACCFELPSIAGNPAGTYNFGIHTGTLIDGAGIFGQGTGATAVLTYQDEAGPYTTDGGPGTLTFTSSKSGPVVVPILFEVYFQASSICFIIAEPGYLPAYEVYGYPGMTSNSSGGFTGTGTEYNNASPPATVGTATVTISNPS